MTGSPASTFRGFTLLELLTTVAIAGILLAIAVPSFTNLSNAAQVRSFTTDITSALNLARSEAARRNRIVRVDPIGTWEDGVTVFVDENNDGVPDNAAAVLKTAQRDPGSLRYTAPALGDIAFFGDGRQVNVGTADFVICGPDADTENARRINIAATGRVSIQYSVATCP